MKVVLTEHEETLVERFRQEVCQQAQQVDADEEQDWFSLSLGFFIACGMTPSRAHAVSLYVRYEKHYWMEEGSR